MNKRQDSIVIKLMFFFLGLFVLLYMGYHLVNFIRDPLTTTTPILQTAEDTLTINGYFVRNETVVARGAGIVDWRVDEGTRVANGQVLAALYGSQAALDNNRAIETLRTRRDMLESILSHTDTFTDAAALDAEIYTQLAAISASVDAATTQSLDSQSQALRRMLFMREHHFSDSDDIQAMMHAIDEELSHMQAAQTATTITSPMTAYFSSYVDGYEGLLKPDSLTGLTVATVRSWASQRAVVDENAVLGKLVPDFEWYYVAIVPFDEARKLDTVTVRFGQNFWNLVTLTVVSVGGDENGECVVLFRSRDSVSDTIRARRQSADIIFNDYTGLRIPKKALHINENGETGVYCLEGSYARWKKVEIVYQTETFYLVTYDKTSVKALSQSDEVLLGGKLYDGKKVK